MKKILYAFALSFLSITAYSQAFDGKGDMKLQIGFIPYGYGSGILGTYDIGILDAVSVGAGMELYFDESGNKDRNFFAHARANLHLNEILNLPYELDIYPGVDLGFTADGVGLGIHAGFRYFFTNDIGVFLELGSRGSFGISINL